MLHQEKSTQNILEMSIKSCSKMWESLLWFMFSLDLKTPHLKPKQEPLELWAINGENESVIPLFIAASDV